jgi:SAM-dependent methyltransferase
VSGAEERLANDPTSALWGEHRSRYRFAAGLARPGQRILDAASGAGFGLWLLERTGACAVGVDYAANALSDVRRRQPLARVVRADATRLPFHSEAFDLVVSFETIEHVADACALVHGIRRVLKPGGYLVLSTPNRDFGPPGLHARNPFHVREFTPDDLRFLLSEAFREVRLYGQRPRPTYRYVPFLMVDRDLSPAAFAWKLMVRLPFRVKDGLARVLTDRAFYPGEEDYCFEPERVDGAHALVAVAR